MSYGRFAEIYDTLMVDVPYEEWITFTEEAFKTAEVNVQSILDIGCGTGEISIRFSQQGYDVTGIDVSEDMLAVARDKSDQQKASVQWVQQDMTDLDMSTQYDAAVSYCDVVNYLTDPDQVKQALQKAFDVIKPGGLFLFDTHSISYVDQFLADQTFGTVKDDISYIWFCDKGEEDHEVTHDLTFFVKKDDLYERFDEFHHQRTFPVATYVEWLQETGFNVIGIHSDFSKEAGYDEEENDRIFYICEKTK